MFMMEVQPYMILSSWIASFSVSKLIRLFDEFLVLVLLKIGLDHLTFFSHKTLLEKPAETRPKTSTKTQHNPGLVGDRSLATPAYVVFWGWSMH